jgi:hypothetical protein
MTSAFGNKPAVILKVFQRFGKHCSCHLQGYVLGGPNSEDDTAMLAETLRNQHSSWRIPESRNSSCGNLRITRFRRSEIRHFVHGMYQ